MWTCGVSRFEGVADPAEVRRGRVVVDARRGLVWHFPSMVGAENSGLLPVEEWHWYRARFAARTGYSRVRERTELAVGVRSCPACRTLEVAPLEWPGDAYYLVSVKRTRVYGANPTDFAAIRGFLAAKNRRELYRTGLAPWCARYLPAGAISGKNREAIVRAMEALLRRA